MRSEYEAVRDAFRLGAEEIDKLRKEIEELKAERDKYKHLFWEKQEIHEHDMDQMKKQIKALKEALHSVKIIGNDLN